MSFFSDGAIPFGTRKIDVYPATAPGANGQASSYAGAVKKGTYTCEALSPDRPARVVRQYSEVNQPQGAFATDDFDTVSTTVQVSDVTKPIARYDGFTVKLDNNTVESWWATNVSTPEQQGEYRKQTVNWQKLVSIAGPPLTQ
jgi:hypothetical protein